METDLPVRRNREWSNRHLRTASRAEPDSVGDWLSGAVNVACRYNRSVRPDDFFQNGIATKRTWICKPSGGTLIRKKHFVRYIAEERRFLEIENEVTDALLKLIWRKSKFYGRQNAPKLIIKWAKKDIIEVEEIGKEEGNSQSKQTPKAFVYCFISHRRSRSGRGADSDFRGRQRRRRSACAAFGFIWRKFKSRKFRPGGRTNHYVDNRTGRANKAEN